MKWALVVVVLRKAAPDSQQNLNLNKNMKDETFSVMQKNFFSVFEI